MNLSKVVILQQESVMFNGKKSKAIVNQKFHTTPPLSEKINFTFSEELLPISIQISMYLTFIKENGSWRKVEVG
jgi:hypothetical protein